MASSDYEAMVSSDLADVTLGYSPELLPEEREAESPYVVMDRHIDELRAYLEDVETRLAVLEELVRAGAAS